MKKYLPLVIFVITLIPALLLIPSEAFVTVNLIGIIYAIGLYFFYKYTKIGQELLSKTDEILKKIIKE